MNQSKKNDGGNAVIWNGSKIPVSGNGHIGTTKVMGSFIVTKPAYEKALNSAGEKLRGSYGKNTRDNRK